MLAYIMAIQKAFIEKYGFAENPDKPGTPLEVPDGEYPMTIKGRRDKIRIEDGKIFCRNFD